MKKKTEDRTNVLQKIMSENGQRPVAYYPVLRKIITSPNSVLMLSQILYWATVTEKWFYKTNEGLVKETGLTKDEVKRAKKFILKLPFVKYKRASQPRRSYYQIDWVLFREAIEEACMIDESEFIEEDELEGLEDNSMGHRAPYLESEDPIVGVNDNYSDGSLDTIVRATEHHTYGSTDTIGTGQIAPTTSETTTENTKETTAEKVIGSNEPITPVEDKPQKTVINYSPLFEFIWKLYPAHTSMKGKKPQAFKEYEKSVELYPHDDIVRAVQKYSESKMFELRPCHLSSFLSGIRDANHKYYNDFIKGGYEEKLLEVKTREAIKHGSTKTAKQRYLEDLTLQGPLNSDDLIRRTSLLQVQIGVDNDVSTSLITNGERHEWVQYTGPDYLALQIKHPRSKLDKTKVIFHIDELRNNLYVHLHGHEWTEAFEDRYQETNVGVPNIPGLPLPEIEGHD